MFHSYLQSATPDIADILTIKPVGEMLPATFKKPQQAFFTDAGGEQVNSYSAKWHIIQRIPWDYLSAEDKETIFNLYFSASKANGKQYSFTWAHPVDGQYYIAYFGMDLSWAEAAAGYFYSSNVVLKIIGYTTPAAVALLADTGIALLVDTDIALII
jgi:hypothetical protein